MAITKIQPNAIPSGTDFTIQLTDGSVVTADIADSNVTTAKIADANVTHAKLHTDMDLSGKTVTLSSPTISDYIFYENAYMTNSTADLRIEPAGGQSSQGFAFLARNSSGSLQYAMGIDRDGNVGIGTYSPLAKLDVTGIIRSSDGTRAYQTYASASQNVLYTGSSTNHDVAFTTNNTERMRINSSGDVGIGMAPDEWFSNRSALQFGNAVGAISMANGLEIGLNFKVVPNTASEQWVQNGYAAKMTMDAGDGHIRFHTAGNGTADTNLTWSERLRITNTGLVGIGSTSPYNPGNAKHLTIYNSSPTWNQRAGIFMATESQGTYNAEIYYHRGTSTETDRGLKFRVHDTMVAAMDSDGRLIVGGDTAYYGTGTNTTKANLVVKAGATTDYSSTVQTGVNDHGIRVFTAENENESVGIWFNTGGTAHMSGISGNRSNHTSNWATHLSFFTHQNSTSGLYQAYEKMRIDGEGNIGAPSGSNIYNASDVRLKQNITTLNNALAKINALRGVSFNWKDGFCDDEKDKTMYGFIAQEVQEVDVNISEQFGSGHDIALSETEIVENPLRVNEKFVIPLLVEAIKELTSKVESLEAQLNGL